MTKTTSAKTAPKKTKSAQPKVEEKKSAPKEVENSIIDENIKFNLSIPWETVQKAMDEALDHLAAGAQIDGFRQGKAPKKLVAERLGRQKLFEHAIDHMLPQAYSAEVQKRGLKPVVNPHIDPVSLNEGQTWEFAVQTAEAPKIDITGYQKVVQAAKPAPQVLVPGKKEEPAGNSEDEKLRAIFTALLEKYQPKIAELIVRVEVNRTLSKLVEQLDRMHIPLEQYLNSVGKTSDQLRQEYAMSALTSLQLEFLLAEIAKAEKIDVSSKDIDEVIDSLPNEDIKKANNTPDQRLSIAAGLVKKKVVAHVLAL